MEMCKLVELLLLPMLYLRYVDTFVIELVHANFLLNVVIIVHHIYAYYN